MEAMPAQGEENGRKLFGGDASTNTNGPVHWHLQTSSRTAKRMENICYISTRGSRRKER